MKLRGDRCRCTKCGELLNSTYAFDKHRQGPYTDRRCLSTAAMAERRFMQNQDGFWLSPRKTELLHRRAA